jgi:hypothetical protein
MLYGMTNRLGWSGDPRPIWKRWDDFGIQDAKMIGHWDSSCLAKTDDESILATVYRKRGKALIVLASWLKRPHQCRLMIDRKSLGLDAGKARLFAAEIEGLQTAGVVTVAGEISIIAGGGGDLLVDEELRLPGELPAIDARRIRWTGQVAWSAISLRYCFLTQSKYSLSRKNFVAIGFLPW